MSTHDQGSAHTLTVTDYSSAIAKAVEWLGDRYLLARPINTGAAGEWVSAARLAPYVRSRKLPLS
jgi:hypothetical protein